MQSRCLSICRLVSGCDCVHVCREYEARIAELKEQFGQEQADKAKLQLELDKLQKEWDEQLQTLQTQVNHGMISTCTCM